MMRYILLFFLVISLWALKDSDHDGIIDKYDKCPHTKQGDLVDSDGCSLFGDEQYNDSKIESNHNADLSDIDNIDDSDKLLFEILNDDSNMSNIDLNEEDVLTKTYNLYFKRGKYKLDEESSIKLEEIAQYLKTHPNVRAQIIGYTDSIGRASDNKILSIKRAKFVYNKLISMGINKDRLSYDGFGEEFPLYPNDTEEHRALNRRVEVRFIP